MGGFVKIFNTICWALVLINAVMQLILIQELVKTPPTQDTENEIWDELSMLVLDEIDSSGDTHTFSLNDKNQLMIDGRLVSALTATEIDKIVQDIRPAIEGEERRIIEESRAHSLDYITMREL